MAKNQAFRVWLKDGDTVRVYELVAKDQTAAEELVRESEARQDEPLKISKTEEV